MDAEDRDAMQEELRDKSIRRICKRCRNARAACQCLQVARAPGSRARRCGLVFATGGHNRYSTDGAQWIELRQVSRRAFTVIYGADMKTGLTYEGAALALGAAIMHDAACDGLIIDG